MIAGGGVSCMAGWKKEPVRSEMENEKAPRKKRVFSFFFSLSGRIPRRHER